MMGSSRAGGGGRARDPLRRQLLLGIVAVTLLSAPDTWALPESRVSTPPGASGDDVDAERPPGRGVAQRSGDVVRVGRVGLGAGLGGVFGGADNAPLLLLTTGIEGYLRPWLVLHGAFGMSMILPDPSPPTGSGSSSALPSPFGPLLPTTRDGGGGVVNRLWTALPCVYGGVAVRLPSGGVRPFGGLRASVLQYGSRRPSESIRGYSAPDRQRTPVLAGGPEAHGGVELSGPGGLVVTVAGTLGAVFASNPLGSLMLGRAGLLVGISAELPAAPSHADRPTNQEAAPAPEKGRTREP